MAMPGRLLRQSAETGRRVRLLRLTLGDSYGEDVSWLCRTGLDSPHRQFNYVVGMWNNGSDAPRDNTMSRLQHTIPFVYEKDIDREGHEEGMDAAAGADDQALPWSEFMAANEPAQPGPPTTGDPGLLGHQGAAGLVLDERLSHMYTPFARHLVDLCESVPERAQNVQ